MEPVQRLAEATQSDPYLYIGIGIIVAFMAFEKVYNLLHKKNKNNPVDFDRLDDRIGDIHKWADSNTPKFNTKLLEKIIDKLDRIHDELRKR